MPVTAVASVSVITRQSKLTVSVRLRRKSQTPGPPEYLVRTLLTAPSVPGLLAWGPLRDDPRSQPLLLI
jgi:hypothetical protein